MREFLQLAGILTLISVLSGWALSYTYTITKPIIEVKRYEKKVAAIAQVLPAFNNQPEKEAVKVSNSQGEAVEFYVGKKDGTPTGVAFRSAAVGYGGTISLMIGVTPDGKVYGLQVLDQNETPGLGNKVTQDAYIRQFLSKDLNSSRWEVKKMGGDFDQVTAATISSRAITRGIREGLTLYQAHQEKILKAG